MPGHGTGPALSPIGHNHKRHFAANQNAINWERSYDGMKAYSQSKIACGLFGLELEWRSQAEGWGITSNLSHFGVVPTSLLSARPEVGRDKDTLGVTGDPIHVRPRHPCRDCRDRKAHGCVRRDVHRRQGWPFYGPSGPGQLGGAPAEQKLHPRLRSVEDAQRIWRLSQDLTKVSFSDS
ncbi:hypothetical protein SUDANB132_00190 [Streptomyces sp. enrichment culture]